MDIIIYGLDNVEYFDIIYCATEKRFGDQFCNYSASAYINKDIPAIQRGVCNLSPAALLLFLTHSAAFKPCTHSPCRSLTSQYYCRSGCSPKTKVFFSLRVKASYSNEIFIYDEFSSLIHGLLANCLVNMIITSKFDETGTVCSI